MAMEHPIPAAFILPMRGGALASRRHAAQAGTISPERNYSAAMQDSSKLDRTRRRAQKLQREAANCLTLAVRERSTDFAADLIEEASMLMRRVNELCGT